MFIASPFVGSFSGWSLGVESSVVSGSVAFLLSFFLFPENARVVCFLDASLAFEFEPKNILQDRKEIISATRTIVTI